MSNDNGAAGPGARQAVGTQVAIMGAGLALSEALFFGCLAGFRHPRALWQLGMPWILLPALGLLLDRTLSD